MIFLWALATILVIFIFLRHFLGRIVLKGLEKKAILITGCDSGFGFELALKCLSNGMRVFGTFLTEKGMKEMEEMALKLPGNFDGFEMDVRNDESVQKGLEFVESKLGNGKGIFALVNNAGIVGNVGWDDWLLAEDYEQVWQVNALGTIRVTQTFKKLLKMEKGSRIILMASTCGRVALPGLGPYSVSKYAIEAYGDTIRTELIIFGIKVAIIEPGFFRTPLTNAQRNAEMLNRIWERTKPEVKAEYGQALYQYSMNRLLTVLDPSKLNSNIGLVVDAYWHAITSAWPKRRYQVGADIKLFFLPFSFLPAELQDIFYQIVHFFQRPPIGERNKKGGETNDGFSKFIVK